MEHLLLEAEILLADVAEEAGLPTDAIRSELRRLGTPETIVGVCRGDEGHGDNGCGHGDGDGRGYGYGYRSGDGSGAGSVAVDGGGYGDGELYGNGYML